MGRPTEEVEVGAVDGEVEVGAVDGEEVGAAKYAISIERANFLLFTSMVLMKLMKLAQFLLHLACSRWTQKTWSSFRAPETEMK